MLTRFNFVPFDYKCIYSLVVNQICNSYWKILYSTHQGSYRKGVTSSISLRFKAVKFYCV